MGRGRIGFRHKKNTDHRDGRMPVFFLRLEVRRGSNTSEVVIGLPAGYAVHIPCGRHKQLPVRTVLACHFQ